MGLCPHELFNNTVSVQVLELTIVINNNGNRSLFLHDNVQSWIACGVMHK